MQESKKFGLYFILENCVMIKDVELYKLSKVYTIIVE